MVQGGLQQAINNLLRNICSLISPHNTSTGAGADNDGGVNGYFDASKSNPIYGKSDTVQPASYTIYYIMRVK